MFFSVLKMPDYSMIWAVRPSAHFPGCGWQPRRLRKQSEQGSWCRSVGLSVCRLKKEWKRRHVRLVSAAVVRLVFSVVSSDRHVHLCDWMNHSRCCRVSSLNGAQASQPSTRRHICLMIYSLFALHLACPLQQQHQWPLPAPCVSICAHLRAVH